MNAFFNSLPLPLSDEETTKYFEMMKKGNKEAKNKLIEHNLRLVYYLALKYKKKVYTQNFYFSVDDLMSIGSIGLIKAVTSFDQTKGASFATYASKGIELEILNYIRKHKNLDVSLHQSLSKDQDGHLFTIEDSLTSTSNIEKEYISKENYEELKPALKILTNEERKVIRLRYGNHKVSQEKIAQMLDYSQSYVSRIEKKALRKIKNYLKGITHEEIEFTTEIKPNIKDKTKKKILEVANTFLKENLTFKELAKKFNVSISTIHVYLTYKLKFVDELLYKEVLSTMNRRQDEKKKKVIDRKRKYEKTLDEIKKVPFKKQNDSEKEKRIRRNTTPIPIDEIFPHQPEEKILKAIDMLNEVNKKIFKMKHGLSGYNRTHIDDIAKEMNMSASNVSLRLYNSKKMINKILNDPKLMSKLDNEFFSLFTGFTKEEILEVVNQLDNNKKLIIELYFGLNGKEKTGVRRIGRMIGLKQSEVKKYVDYIAQFIKKELGNKKNDFDFNYDHEVNQHKGKLLK